MCGVVSSNRIPLSLQKIFIASNGGVDIHNVLPPSDNVGNKVFYRQEKKTTSVDNVSVASPSALSSTIKKKKDNRVSAAKKKRGTLEISPQVWMERLLYSYGYSNGKKRLLNSKEGDSSNDTDWFDLHEYALDGEDEKVKTILKQKSSEWLSNCATLRGVNGETLLHLICRYCSDPEILTIFRRKSSCDIFAADKFGRTSLHHACWRDTPCLKMIDKLINKRSALQLFLVSDMYGSCPLSYVQRGNWRRYNQYINQKKNSWFPSETAEGNKDNCNLESNSNAFSMTTTGCRIPESRMAKKISNIDENTKVVKEKSTQCLTTNMVNKETNDSYYDISNDKILKEMMELVNARRVASVA